MVLETGISEKVEVGDPDPALFSIPPTYKFEKVTLLTSAASSAVQVDPIAQASKLSQMVPPVYPTAAKQARIQGIVKLQIVIGPEGHVQDAKLLSGLPILAPAAIAAVKQYLYRPTLLNGQPIEVTTSVDIPFRLDQQ